MNSQEISKIYKTHSPVPPSTSWTGSLPGFSRSSKLGSSVDISNGFPDLENMNSVKISKIYMTKSSVPLESEVDLDFRDLSCSQTIQSEIRQ